MPDIVARAVGSVSESGARLLSDSAARPLSDSAARPLSESARARSRRTRRPQWARASAARSRETTWRNTALPAERKRTKVVIAFAALAGLAFGLAVIALSQKKAKTEQVSAPQDATRVVMSADAGVIVEPIAIDAAAEPTEPRAPTVEPIVDAAVEAPPVDEKMAYLVVRTIPDGGTIKVGDQSRLATVQPGDPTRSATAQLVLPPGRHVVTAQLAGYRPEKRDVVLEAGVQQKIEIAFTKKLVTRPERGPAHGPAHRAHDAVERRLSRRQEARPGAVRGSRDSAGHAHATFKNPSLRAGHKEGDDQGRQADEAELLDPVTLRAQARARGR